VDVILFSRPIFGSCGIGKIVVDCVRSARSEFNLNCARQSMYFSSCHASILLGFLWCKEYPSCRLPHYVPGTVASIPSILQCFDRAWSSTYTCGTNYPFQCSYSTDYLASSNTQIHLTTSSVLRCLRLEKHFIYVTSLHWLTVLELPGTWYLKSYVPSLWSTVIVDIFKVSVCALLRKMRCRHPPNPDNATINNLLKTTRLSTATACIFFNQWLCVLVHVNDFASFHR